MYFSLYQFFAYLFVQLKGIIGQSKLLKRLSQDWESVASDAFFLHRNDSATLQKLRKYHFGDTEREITVADYPAITDVVGDRCFNLPVRDAALLHATQTGYPTYLYYFTEKGDVSFGDFIYTLAEESWIPRPLQILLHLAKNKIYSQLNLESIDLGKLKSSFYHFNYFR